MTADSLCQTCAFARLVRGRLGQTYILCRSDAVPDKYPRQPIRSCTGFEPLRPKP